MTQPKASYGAVPEGMSEDDIIEHFYETDRRERELIEDAVNEYDEDYMEVYDEFY